MKRKPLREIIPCNPFLSFVNRCHQCASVKNGVTILPVRPFAKLPLQYLKVIDKLGPLLKSDHRQSYRTWSSPVVAMASRIVLFQVFFSFRNA